MGGAKNPLLAGPVLQFVKGIHHGLVATGLMPYLGGLKGRHQDFNAPGAVHFGTNNRLDLFQRPQSQGQKGIQPTR